MASSEIHENDIGTVFELTVKEGALVVDDSGATTKQIYFKKPDGTVVTKTAAFSSDGTDGKLKYTTVTGDLTPTGSWEIQCHLIFSTGEWKTDIGTFTVHPNLT